jgi:excisionase family DNA binding protein
MSYKEEASMAAPILETNKRMLSSGEVARFCGVHFRTVIRWIEKGSLKAHKLPGRGNNRIAEEDFLTFLKDNNLPIPTEFKKNKERVLIVDDDHAVGAAIERVLRRGGFDTKMVYDGFSAGNMLATFEPDVLTLDLQMPQVNGFEVLDFITSQPRYSDLKILVVSALADEELKKAKEHGAHDCLSKPFENKELLERVSELLKQT